MKASLEKALAEAHALGGPLGAMYENEVKQMRDTRLRARQKERARAVKAMLKACTLAELEINRLSAEVEKLRSKGK